MGKALIDSPIGVVTVIANDIGIGQFGGGVPAKEWLLRREGSLY